MENILTLKQVNFKNSKDIQKALDFLRLNANVSPLFQQYQSIIDKLPNVAINCIARCYAETTSKYKTGMQFIEYNSKPVGIIGFFVREECNNKINKAELSVFLAPEFIGNKNGISVWKTACRSYIELLGKNEKEFNPKGEFTSKYVSNNRVSQHIQNSLGIVQASSIKSELKCGEVSIVKLTGTFEAFFKSVVYPVVRCPAPRL